MRSARIFVLLTLVSAVPLGCDDDKKPASATGTDAGAGGAAGSAGSTGSGGSGTAAGGTTGAGGAGTPGAGGSGAGGAGAGLGGAGGNPAIACSIPCIAALTKDCVPSGTCTEQASGSFGSNKCYANGVKVISMLSFALPPAPTTWNATYKKQDGSVCYTFGVEYMEPNATLVWKDAAGKTVATGTGNPTTMQVTVTCDGKTYDPAAAATCASTISLPSLPGVPGSGGPMCTMGACAP